MSLVNAAGTPSSISLTSIRDSLLSLDNPASSTTTNNSTPPPPGGHRIVVGVDFGTTYSGVAWAHTASPQDLHVIQSWPGGANLTSPKVPSKLAYDSNGGIKWGFQIKPFQPCIECFKLFLDPAQTRPKPEFVSLAKMNAQLRAQGIDNVVDVVRDYLQQLYDHTMVVLNRALGQAFVESTAIEWVLTCPAVWSDKSKAATLAAAERTGMGKWRGIRLISEPEAAAMYTLKTLQVSNLEVGNNFVVCDAGGGTVDLISYEVTQTSPLRIKESVPGTGELCGSAMLNERFDRFVQERLGPAVYYTMKEKTKLAAMKTWEEYVKRVFVDGEDQDVFPIQFPGLPDNEAMGIDCGFMSVTREEVQQIFEPIIQDVVKLVDGQIAAVMNAGKQVSTILLVGGFGSSEYLYTRLKEKYEPLLTPTPGNSDTILQPVDAWTAVVRGAVIRGMETMVQTRRSRHHYGVKYWEYYDENKHLEGHKYWDTTREKWLAENQIKWYIEKGAELSDLTPVSFPFYITFEEHHSRILVDELVACDDVIPPPAITDSVITVCKLTSDLTNVPKNLYTKGRNSKDVEYEGLHFTMDMSVLSAGLKFELKVDGEKYGEVTADFE